MSHFVIIIAGMNDKIISTISVAFFLVAMYEKSYNSMYYYWISLIISIAASWTYIIIKIIPDVKKIFSK